MNPTKRTNSAARRVAAFPPSVAVHYVSQDVKMGEETRRLCPAEVVVAADVERRLLLEELARLQGADDTAATTAAASGSSGEATVATTGAAAEAAVGGGGVGSGGSSGGGKDDDPSGRLVAVVERLEVIEADAAPQRARQLLLNVSELLGY